MLAVRIESAYPLKDMLQSSTECTRDRFGLALVCMRLDIALTNRRLPGVFHGGIIDRIPGIFYNFERNACKLGSNPVTHLLRSTRPAFF